MSSCENTSNTQLSVADGYHDYDMTTGNPARTCALSNCVTRGIPFKAKPTDPANQITFPFEEGNALSEFGGNPQNLVDAGLLEEMKLAAADQGNYKPINASATVNIGNNGPYAWPGGPGEDIRYFVEGKNGAVADVHFEVCTPGGPPWPKGVIVVQNGNFTFDNACGQNAGFEGVVIVIGNGNTTGKYSQVGQYDLDGYVAASGKMTINGAVRPRTTIDLENLNSFYTVSQWSWRELYQ
jgi:hypothetical protein